MMFTVPSNFYEVGMGSLDENCEYNNEMFLQVPEIGNPLHEHEVSPRAIAEAKAVAASNSHKEAERRRRKRINAHIATLKSILPNTIKTDKASLLGEAVRRVKELKETSAEVQTALEYSDNTRSATSLRVMFPSEADELKLSNCEASGLIKATLSCDDRPEMILDLIHAVKSAEAKVVRAEMSTLGGRTKMLLWVKLKQQMPMTSSSSPADVALGTLRRALKMAIDKSTFLAGSGQDLPGNKRPRHYHL